MTAASALADMTPPIDIEIADAAKSCNNTLQDVGIKMSGAFQCKHCRQKFDTEKAQLIHWKFTHRDDTDRDNDVDRITGAEETVDEVACKRQ